MLENFHVPGMSQHSRCDDYYYFLPKRLGIIFRWDGSLETVLWGRSDPVFLSPYDVRHKKHSSTIIKKLLSQQLISGMGCQYISLPHYDTASHNQNVE